jgi:hypothetical protein
LSGAEAAALAALAGAAVAASSFLPQALRTDKVAKAKADSAACWSKVRLCMEKTKPKKEEKKI